MDRIDPNLLCMESHDSNSAYINSNRHESAGMVRKCGEWLGNAMDGSISTEWAGIWKLDWNLVALDRYG